MNPSNHKILILTGPTAIGKSELSYFIRHHIGGHIISADSRQVYKEMTIGTAKPSLDEIEHNKIVCCNHVSIHDEYNAGIFADEAMAFAKLDWTQSGYCFISGGTGMYIRAFTEGLDDFPDIPQEIREKWNELLSQKGIGFIQNALKDKDPQYFAEVDINNPHRMIRALTVIEYSKKSFSSFLQNHTKPSHECLHVVLERDKDELNERINNRVLHMMDEGLLSEVEALLPYRSLKALNTVGYNEIFKYFDGEYSLDQAIERIQIHSRQYAKRQRTWQRKFNPGPRFHPDDKAKILNHIKKVFAL